MLLQVLFMVYVVAGPLHGLCCCRSSSWSMLLQVLFMVYVVAGPLHCLCCCRSSSWSMLLQVLFIVYVVAWSSSSWSMLLQVLFIVYVVAGPLHRQQHSSSSARLQQRTHMSFDLDRRLVARPVRAVRVPQHSQHAQ